MLRENIKLPAQRLVSMAYQKVRSNQGAGGVDGVSVTAFHEGYQDHLYKLWNQMSSGSYMPPPVKLQEIPKKGGGLRPLGIPTIADRIAQTVVRGLLEPGLELIFHQDSYGYRPGKSAIAALSRARERCWKLNWAVDLDIKGYFDNISHDLLMKAIKRHCLERWMLFNPVLTGWINYYGQFYKATLVNYMHIVNVKLARWARRKYKNLRASEMKAIRWLHGISIRQPNLLAHWALLGSKPTV